MVRKKMSPIQKSQLKDWFVSKPIKFALLSLGLITGIIFFYFLLNMSVLHINPYMVRGPIFATVGLALGFAIYKLIKWLPSETLDRRSFVAIDNGLTFIYYMAILFSAFLIMNGAQDLMYFSMWVRNFSLPVFILTIVLGSLVYLYVLGLMISNIYATYLRAREMGVSKWKAILSFPFGTTLLWLPGYILPESKKNKEVITIKSKWFNSLTSWIVSKPLNAILIYLITITFSAMFLDLFTTSITAMFGLIFGLWIWATGVDKFRKSIGGAYSSFTASLNIAFIICFLVIIFLPINKLSQPASVQLNPAQVSQAIEQK